jgi:ABC-type multidrug transport system fused ATPase/permease subunit
MELDHEKGISFPADGGFVEVSVQNLSFAYPGSHQVLKDLSFYLPAGKSLCIMGDSGSGKSTLIQLLSGILEPQSGVINFNGLSLQSLKYPSLRKHVGFVLSGVQIFQGSIAENISLGRPGVSTEDILKAIELVNLGDFLINDPHGLNTSLDPEGKRIPGSVVNKIILARAIVTSPKLLILEDPFDQISAQEKEVIIAKLTNDKRPWKMMVATVDPLWKKYIGDVINLDRINLN